MLKRNCHRWSPKWEEIPCGSHLVIWSLWSPSYTEIERKILYSVIYCQGRQVSVVIISGISSMLVTTVSFSYKISFVPPESCDSASLINIFRWFWMMQFSWSWFIRGAVHVEFRKSWNVVQTAMGGGRLSQSQLLVKKFQNTHNLP